MHKLLQCKKFLECEHPVCPLLANEAQLEAFWLPSCEGYPAEPYSNNSPILPNKKSAREENRHEPEE